MDIRRVRTCEKCKVTVPLDRVRLYPKDKDKTLSMVICDECCDKLKNMEKQGPAKQPIKNVPKISPKNVHCTRCNYSFYIDMAKAGVTYKPSCPYCGRTDRLK